MKPPFKVLLVDNNVDFLCAAAKFLATHLGIRVVGQALSAEEALEVSERLQPDLILMDLALPGMNGLEAARRIKTGAKPPRVVILTIHDNPEYRAQALAAGADGFVAKSEFGEQLLPLIDELMGSAGKDDGPREDAAGGGVV